MNPNVKTVLIVGGVLIAGYGAWYLYNKSKTAVTTAAAPAAGSTNAGSGIQAGLTTASTVTSSASGLLTELGNVFGAHSTTGATGASPNPVSSSSGTNADDGESGSDDSDDSDY